MFLATFATLHTKKREQSARHEACLLEVGVQHPAQLFRNLKVWQASMDLVEEVFRVTRTFPSHERFGLTSQIRRASASIASNIGEGKRRKRERAFLHHLDIALGSQGEVEVQLEIARRVGFLREQDYRDLQARVEEVGRMLNGLMSSIQRGGTQQNDEP